MPTDDDDKTAGDAQGQGAQGQGSQAHRDPRSYDARPASGGDKDADGDKPKDEDKPRKGLLQRPVTLIILGAIVLILFVSILLFWLHARNYQSTDDAFVDTHIVRVAPRISGRVSRVWVDDNQIVRVGQKLVEIDPRDQQARLDQARAVSAQADAQIAQAEAQLAQAKAQVKTAQATYAQDKAQVAANAAQAVNAARDYDRYRTLKGVNPAAVSQQQLDQSEAQARTTAAQRDASARQAGGALAQIQAVLAQQKTAVAQIAAGQAQKANAEASIRSSSLDLSYTGVDALVAGAVAQRSVQVGNYVNAGAQVMAIVPLRLWVTANFKETQLDRMRAGQPVTVHVDACPRARITGHVDSIQRGSGQVFGVLPPENATGNFVKVVQRVPVKILLDAYPRDCPLGPGLSVEPRVKVR
jgi:membrane fusion protein, multidrug efflux system